MPTGTAAPPRLARERPSAETVRARITASSSRSAPASSSRLATSADGSSWTRPLIRARLVPVRTTPASERAPSSRPERGDDHGLAGSGLASHRVEARSELEARLVDHPQGVDRELLKHRQDHWSQAVAGRPLAPRQPETGRSNLATRRSVNGASCRRASRTGRAPAAYLDPGTRREVDRATAVAPQHATDLALREHVDRQRGVRRGHHRPSEQGMGADRDQEQRLDLGPDHGSTRTEGVRRRTGRRREDHAVATPSGQRAAVDLDQHLEHPLAGGLLDARLVEGPAVGWSPRRHRGTRTSRVWRSSTK